MEKKISFCGLDCSVCPAYQAAQNDDPELRTATAAQWSKAYQSDIKPEDVFCQGCLTSGERLFAHCRVCQIRKCGQSHQLPNCAHCRDYACDKLQQFFAVAPEARSSLDEIRKKLTPK